MAGDVEALVLLVVLGATVLVGTTIGGRYRVAPPVLLIGMGALLALIPPLSHVVLAPEVVLVLFLPAIIYREALVTSLREVRNNLVVIALLSVVLVGLTTFTVAVTAQALGVDPTAAWVLGAVLAPTDAAAVSGLAKRMPRRLLTTLHAESIINDGTALVLFAVTVGVLVGDSVPSPLDLLGEISLSFVGGIVAGLVVGLIVVQLRRHVDDPLREGALSVLTPFGAFLLAEVFHASGVLGTVVAGLVLAYAGPRVIRARSRVLAYDFWDLSTFLINGGLFVLLGMQIPRAVRSVTSVSTPRALVIALVVTLVVVGTRMAWVLFTPYVFRLVYRGKAARPENRVPWRIRVVAGWSGFRGAVSLAAALAVPLAMTNGQPVGERDLIIFATALAILSIMLVQGTTLPLVVRWAGLSGDPQRVGEVRQARIRAGEAGLAALPEVAADVGADEDVVARVRTDYQALLDDVRAADDEECGTPQARELERQLRLGVLERKRRELTRMRDANEIDDVVLRELQAVLDIEEIRLLGPTTPE
ncbi:Na+/H+ antiporter [Micromonospora krabiensis]|uniref:Sodium/proton antiporter, CPA1 family (TC 2.A.36) n=1 Tax=Micromonospora krabiensis TaxID=307121 RepID=A0A1C3MYM7_9ACTN|nr:Na+/H+ antiporter [Micromonospora krabiensis]SBV25442.1 sodium/proton antiporter, CPA1 family (TC 2.A.36) [Micromonospora krabiensis]